MDNSYKTSRSISPFQKPSLSQTSSSSSSILLNKPSKTSRTPTGFWTSTDSEEPNHQRLPPHHSTFLSTTSGSQSVHLTRPKSGQPSDQTKRFGDKSLSHKPYGKYRFFRNKEDKGNILKPSGDRRLHDSGRKIKEEPLISVKSELSISSNDGYVKGWNNILKNKKRENPPRIIMAVKQKTYKEGTNKMTTKTVEFFEKNKKGYSEFNGSHTVFGDSRIRITVPNSRKTKPMFGSINVSKKGNDIVPRIKGFKTIENFGGKGLFKIKNKQSQSVKFLSDPNSNISRIKTNFMKIKYRNKKDEISSSSKEEIRGSSSVKAPRNPNNWYIKKHKKYFSKKSEFFQLSSSHKSRALREKEVIRMFRKGKKIEKGSSEKKSEDLFFEQLRKKCEKIISESKESKNYRVSKYPKLMNLRTSKSGNSGITPMSKEALKNKFQSPSITSIDPLYIQAFMKKPKKRVKKKKGISFFMAKFLSKRTSKSFFVYEDEKKVIKFRRGLKNKIIEHTADDDFDTDDEQMKLATKQCKKDFIRALDKVRKKLRIKTRAMSMMNISKNRKTKGIINEKLLNLKKVSRNNNKYRKDNSIGTRRQTRKNVIGNFRKRDSIASLASTSVSSSFRPKKSCNKSKTLGPKMVRNEYFKAGKGKRRAVSILPSRSGQTNEIYHYFEKGCRKRNKIGF